MSALAKYTEEINEKILERMQNMEQNNEEIVPAKITKKQRAFMKKQEKANPFLPKKGKIVELPHREEIEMYFQQFLYEEWRKVLMENGWKWNHHLQCWKNRLTKENFAFAEKFLYGEDAIRERELEDENIIY